MNGDLRPAPRRSRAARATGCSLLVVVLLGGLAACGGTDEEAADPAASAPPSSASSSSPTTAVPTDAPACDDVWSEGATIPRFYRGCVQDGALVEDDSLACSSGQRLVIFDDRFYGVAGGEVRASEQALADDRDYGASVRSCRA